MLSVPFSPQTYLAKATERNEHKFRVQAVTSVMFVLEFANVYEQLQMWNPTSGPQEAGKYTRHRPHPTTPS
jgi:hypothetical protein